jgi:UDP-N-acetylmuramoyl-L-alanyl-D-glutamate--2,6-diaminopimelate ligase
MNLQELVNLLEQGGSQGVVKVCADSRKVGAGDVFVAVKGTSADGHDFIPQAVSQGAGYVVCHRRPQSAGGAVVIEVVEPAMVLGALCQASLGWPARKLVSLAVTGTKGKTTTTYLARAVIQPGKRRGLWVRLHTTRGQGYRNRA